MVQPAHLMWEHTDSSNVNRVAYHDDSSTLCVEFAGGALYTYEGVTLDHYHGLVGAESVGRYLNSVIKSTYHYTRFYSEDELLAAIG